MLLDNGRFVFAFKTSNTIWSMTNPVCIHSTYRVLGTSTAAIFLSNDHSLYAPVYLGWSPCLFSFVFHQIQCQSMSSDYKSKCCGFESHCGQKKSIILSHFGLAFVLKLRPFFPELVMSTDLLSFEHPSRLLFCIVFFRFRRVSSRSTDQIQMKSSITFIWGISVHRQNDRLTEKWRRH